MPELEESHLDKLRLRLPVTSAVRLKVHLAFDSIYGSPQALLIEILDPPELDHELSTVIRELTTPKQYSDPVLGCLVLDRSVDWYEGKALWNGEEIKVQLDVSGRDCPQDAAAHAHRLWQGQAGWHERALKAAVAELLSVKNGYWLEESEPPLSPEGFASRLKLDSITIRLNGEFELWFDDGDVFWGHSIAVACDLNGGSWRVSLEG